MKTTNLSNRTLGSRSVGTLLGILLLLFAVRVDTKAQGSTDGATPLGLSPGSPTGSYLLSDFDVVSMYNGGLNFRLPLYQIAGRGGAAYPITLHVQKKWTVYKYFEPGVGYFYYADAGWWSEEGIGLKIFEAGKVNIRSSHREQPAGFPVETLTRITFTAPDGTEYELRDQLTNGQPVSPQTGGFNRYRIFTTSDGTTATFMSDWDIHDDPTFGQGYYDDRPDGYVMLRDGTRFRVDDGTITWMRDRNGNKASFVYDPLRRVTSITDSLNRQVTISYPSGTTGFTQISFKGFGGMPRTIKIGQTNLANALRSDYSMQTIQQLFPELHGGGPVDSTVVNYIELPDGRSYQLRYNPYAELARVVLPTGGAIEYDYAAGLTDGAASGVFSVNDPYLSKYIYRRVIERRIYPNGGGGSGYESKMTYSRSETTTGNLGYVINEQRNASGTLLSKSQHYFYGSPKASFSEKPTHYPAWKDGREYKTEIFDTNGSIILRRMESTFAQRAAVGWWGGTSETAPPNDPRLIETVTSIEPSAANLVSKQTFGFDDAVPFNNQNNIKEYAFGSGAAGSLARETRMTFLTNSSYTGTDVHIRNLPLQVSVYDGGGIERARSATEYDNYALDGSNCDQSNHCPLEPRAGISGFDSSFTTSYTTRGNATAATKYFLVSGAVTGSVTTYSHYDVAGNVTRAVDGRGYRTKLFYDDVFGAPDGNARLNTAPLELAGAASYALLTKITNALNQSVYAQFDYYLSKPVDAEDANGVVASGYFNDSLDRPTQIRRAVNTALQNQTTFAYDDFNRVITTSSDQTTNNDNALVSNVLYDLMGRTVETRQYEGGANYIAVQTQYDALGRAYRTTNPFRPWQSESALWTTQAFDALGRVVSVTTPDNAVVTTSYSGNSVTVTDQIGKARKSVTDALGRLIQVYEDPAGVNYLTSYSYDVLDNLATVTQGSQTRTFVYDSLKRLTSATNPESGAITYQYDNNGNLTQKTDARGVGSTYQYDALNRNTTVDYSNTTTINPDIRRFYDGAVNGKGRFWYSYRGGDYFTGSNVEHSAIDSYDALGRPLVQRQLFKLNETWGPTYQTSRGYNLAGAVVSQIYPSNRSVTYTYDAAGRASSFSGYLGDNTNRTYATGIIYSSLGGMSKEQFGTTTPIFNKLFYNSRGQLAEIRVGTTYSGPTDTGWERGAIINHYSAQCWGVCSPTSSMTDNNGNLRQQDHWINDGSGGVAGLFVQNYDYDSLNRLQRVREGSWQQEFVYDRWGNRTIHQTNTWGDGINKKQFNVSASNNNRLEVPVGQVGTMTYDAAGNLITDTYTGTGTRVYDAENRMTEAQDSYGTSYYTYDADGHRTRRKINGQETWQIYGFEGELLAEYPANGAAGVPQKEYGYRNGQLLVTATAPVGTGTGLQGQYFDNMNFTDLKVTRTDATVNFDWGGGSPYSSIGVDTFTARWTGKVEPQYSQTYTFYTQTDDGVRLWVNGQLLIDKWIDQGPTEWSGQIALTAGQRYDIRMDFYENGGGATAKLSWSSASQPKQIIPQNRLYLPGVSSQVTFNWLVTDQLGTPRILLDQTGSLSGVRRHDYLPFGEELFAGIGGRTTTLGYSPGNVRQQFTLYERDNETNLDYAQARYYSSGQGRFTGVDPVGGNVVDPQTLNGYSYVANNPLTAVDPDGRYPRSQHRFITFMMAAMLGLPDADDIGRGAGDQDSFWKAATLPWNLGKHFGRPDPMGRLVQLKGKELGSKLHLVEDNAPGAPHQLSGCDGDNGCYGLGDTALSILRHIWGDLTGNSPDKSGNLNGFRAAWNVLRQKAKQDTVPFPDDVFGPLINYLNQNGLTIAGVSYTPPGGGPAVTSGSQLPAGAVLVSTQVISPTMTVRIYRVPKKKKAVIRAGAGNNSGDQEVENPPSN